MYFFKAYRKIIKIKGDEKMRDTRNKLDAITGLIAVCSSAAGVASFAAMAVTLLNGESAVARVCLAATVLSCGLLANAVFLGPRLSQP